MSEGVAGPSRQAFLSKVLFGWMTLAVLVILSYGAWMPIVPFVMLAPGVLAIYLVAPAALLAWSVWAAVRRLRTAWPAPLLLIAFCGGFVLAAQKLAIAGGYLGLVAHRGAYDAIVRDAKSGRLTSRNGWAEGHQGSVRYGFADATAIVFPWDHDPHGGWIGIIHDERDCPPAPATPSAQPLPSSSSLELAPPTIKNAGRFDQRFHLADHYCLSVFNGM